MGPRVNRSRCTRTRTHPSTAERDPTEPTESLRPWLPPARLTTMLPAVRTKARRTAAGGGVDLRRKVRRELEPWRASPPLSRLSRVQHAASVGPHRMRSRSTRDTMRKMAVRRACRPGAVISHVEGKRIDGAVPGYSAEVMRPEARTPEYPARKPRALSSVAPLTLRGRRLWNRRPT